MAQWPVSGEQIDSGIARGGQLRTLTNVLTLTFKRRVRRAHLTLTEAVEALRDLTSAMVLQLGATSSSIVEVPIAGIGGSDQIQDLRLMREVGSAVTA